MTISNFLKNIDINNINWLFKDQEKTDKAIKNLNEDNQKILSSNLDFLKKNNINPYYDIISNDSPNYEIDSIENQLIEKISQQEDMSFKVNEDIRKISYLANEAEQANNYNKNKNYIAAMPIEIIFDENADNIEIDKIEINQKVIEDLIKEYKLISSGVDIKVSKHAFWAPCYPAHKRSEYMRHLLNRIELNREDEKYEIKPVRSKTYVYDGKFPKYMREYFLIIQLSNCQKNKALNNLHKIAEKLLYNGIQTTIKNSDNRIIKAKCHKVDLISNALPVIDKLSAKGFILDSLLPLLDEEEQEIDDIAIYIRTSSMFSKTPYNQDKDCVIDIVIPGYEFEHKAGEQDQPIISFKCENSIQAIELLEGIKMVADVLENAINGEFIFSTVQYEEDGAMVYTSPEKFSKSFDKFKKGLDFYYYEDNTDLNNFNPEKTPNSDDTIIPFPGKKK